MKSTSTRWRTLIVTVLIAAGGAALAGGADAPRPPPPADEWKGTAEAHTDTMPLSADRPFSIGKHAELSPAGMLCSEAINRSIYRQDILHAFESRAHFDNCAFNESLTYLQQLIAKSDRIIVASRSSSDERARQAAAQMAMGVLGQAAHAIQDFYAHSNYVELMGEAADRPSATIQLRVVPVWLETEGAAEIDALVKRGLVSGRVFWAEPKRCVSSAPTHGQLAKDSPQTTAGKQPSAWAGQNRFSVAYVLALRATADFFAWSAKKWPELPTLCGGEITVIPGLDRREVSE